jgi:hypothetical protein
MSNDFRNFNTETKEQMIKKSTEMRKTFNLIGLMFIILIAITIYRTYFLGY